MKKLLMILFLLIATLSFAQAGPGPGVFPPPSACVAQTPTGTWAYLNMDGSGNLFTGGAALTPQGPAGYVAPMAPVGFGPDGTFHYLLVDSSGNLKVSGSSGGTVPVNSTRLGSNSLGAIIDDSVGEVIPAVAAGDNTTVIQNAINSANANGTCVIIPAGTWSFNTTLTLYSTSLVNSQRNLPCIKGAGGLVNNYGSNPASTAISALQYTGTGTALELYDGSHLSYGGYFKNFGVKCGNAAGCAVGIDADNANTTYFEDIGVMPGTGNSGYSLTDHVFADAWNLTAANAITIKRAFTSFSGIGFKFSNSNGINISGLDSYEVTNCFDFLGSATNINIHDNPNIESCDKIFSFDANPAGTQNYTQFDFERNSVLFDPVSPYAPANMVFASATSSGGGHGLNIFPFSIEKSNFLWSTPQNYAVTTSGANPVAMMNFKGNSFTGLTTSICNAGSAIEFLCSNDLGLNSVSTESTYLGNDATAPTIEINSNGDLFPVNDNSNASGQSGNAWLNVQTYELNGQAVAAAGGFRMMSWSMNNTGTSTSATQFIGMGIASAGASAVDVPIPFAATFGNCSVRTASPMTGSMTLTYTLEKNGSDCGSPSAVQVVFNSGTGGAGTVLQDITNTCTVAVKDRLSWKAVPTNSANVDYPAMSCSY